MAERPLVKNPPANTGDTRDTGSFPGWEDPLEEEMATHCSSLAWRIPWTREPGGLQSCSPWGRKESDTTEASRHCTVCTRVCTHMYLHRLMDLICNSISATIGPPENIRVTPKEGSLIIRLSAPFDVPAAEASFVYHVYYWEEAGGKQARACPSLFLMFFSLEFLSSR